MMETVVPDDLPPEPTRSYTGDKTVLPTSDELRMMTFVAEGKDGYELRQMIGRGGMGEVWEAVQRSLDRVVAVKRVRHDNMTDLPPQERALREVLFRQEARVSALLEHPNIVPVHDLGRDPDGMGLLAMKRVHGKQWDQLIDEDVETLPVPDFLSRHLPILVSVAQAVAFAHSRGIVHRDIKPGQVMVGEYGEVLLMDWGLALFAGAEVFLKPDAVPLGLPTPLSASNPAGTPALMAPEQTRKTADQLGPWTDVYLLGATLYALLATTFPHLADTARGAFMRAAEGIIQPPSERAPDRDIPPELEALCLEALVADYRQRTLTAPQFAARISDYLSGTSRRRESIALWEKAHAEFKSITTRSHAEDDYLRHQAVGDDAVRALLIWPENAEARDLVQNNLAALTRLEIAQGDLGVARVHIRELARLAQPQDSTVNKLRAELDQADRARQAARRQRQMLVASVAVLGLLLLTAFGFATFQRQQSKLAEERAHEQARLRELFEQAKNLREDENKLATELGREAPVPSRLALDPNEEGGSSDRLEKLLVQRDKLREVRASILRENVRLEGEPYALVLADTNIALANAGKDKARALEAYRQYMTISSDRSDLPEPLIGAGIAAFRGDEITSACLAIDKATSLTLGLHGPESSRYADVLALAGEAHQRIEDTTEGYRDYFRRSLNVLEPMHLKSAQTIAELYHKLGQPLDALAITTPTLTLARRHRATDPRLLSNFYNSTGVFFMEAERMGEAMPYLEEAIRLKEEEKNSDPETLALMMNNLGGLYLNQGEFAKAEPLVRKSMALREKVLPPDHPALGTTYNTMGGMMLELGRAEEAIPYYRKALAIRQKQFGPDHPRVAATLCGLGMGLREVEQDEEAVMMLRQALSIQEKSLGPNSPMIGRTLNALGASYDFMGKYKEAEESFRRCLQVTEPYEHSGDYCSALTRLGGLLVRLKRNDEGMMLLRRAVEETDKAFGGKDHHATGMAHVNLGLALCTTDREEEGIKTYEEGIANLSRSIPEIQPDLVKSRFDGSLIYFGYAERLRSEGNIKRAEELYRRILTLIDKSLPTYEAEGRALARAGAYYRLGMIDEARAELPLAAKAGNETRFDVVKKVLSDAGLLPASSVK